MKKFALILLVFGHVQMGYCGGEKILFGARGLSLGHASATLIDAFSPGNNQATMAYLKDPVAGLYHERRFMLGALSSNGLAFAYPTRGGTFGLTASHFGYSNYSDTQLGLGFAKKLSKRFSAGIQIDYLGTQAIESGSKANVTFEAGLFAQLTRELTFAAHVYNPIRANLGEYLGEQEKVPGILKTGMRYFKEDQFSVMIEAEKDIDYDPFMKIGIEIYLSDKITARGGVSTRPSTYSLGVGFQVKDMNIDLGASNHQFLGFTPGVSVAYKFVKKEEELE